MEIKTLVIDNLQIKIGNTVDEMGLLSATDVANCIRRFLEKQDEINVVFAAAPSQLSFLYHLEKQENIDWSRVNVFHMDEYIGVGIEQTQSFAKFVKEYVVDKFNPKQYFYIKGDALDTDEECFRYSSLLAVYPPDIVCCGIGENGHIAFNDPCEADFNDKKMVRVVNLDGLCRKQQVNDKCFEKIEDVPKQAYTLTIPALMQAKEIFCIVPGKQKANAVERTLFGEISHSCPASILRRHNKSWLYCDVNSGASLINNFNK